MTDLNLAALDLQIDDRDPQAIFDAAAAALREGVFGIELRNGSVEAVLLEAVAVANADVIYAVNRLLTFTVQGVLALFGVVRDEGQPATAIVRLTFDDTRDAGIPAGTLLSLPGSGIALVVVADVTATAVTYVDVPVATREPTAAVNGLASGAAIDLLDSIPYVASAATITTFAGGSSPETDAAYFNRARARLVRVTDSLVLADHFSAFCLEDPRVGRAGTVDVWDPTSGNDPGEDPGHVTVAVYGLGAALSAPVKAELLADMQARAMATLQVHVMDAVITTIPITVEVQALSGFNTADVSDAVKTAIRGYVSPATWPFDADLRVLALGAVIAAVPGVDFVSTITAPASDTALSGPGALALAGTVTVTML